MLKMIQLHPNFPTNAKVTFKFCSSIITILTYQASKIDKYMAILNLIFNSD